MKQVKPGILIIVTLLLCNACSLLPFSTAGQQFDAGLSLFNQGEFEESIPYFRRVTELEPEYGEAYLYLGRSYVSLSQWGPAIPALRSAYRFSPSETRNQTLQILLDGLIGAAFFDTKKGNFSHAIGYLHETLELAPDSGKAKSAFGKTLFSYGTHLVSQGNLTEAIPKFQEATKFTPNEFGPYFSLAKALFQKGQIPDALSALQNATRLNPGSSKAQNLLLQLLMNK
jgi:tetratricopeptide (TPR) repeat protein